MAWLAASHVRRAAHQGAAAHPALGSAAPAQSHRPRPGVPAPALAAEKRPRSRRHRRLSGMEAGIARMRDNNVAETVIGAVVVAIAVLFIAFLYTRTGSGGLSGYEIQARLPRVDGLGMGTDVRLA